MTNDSFQHAAWKRLKKNKGAVFGLLVICLAVITAIFAYFIAPDSSPFANRIILEIGGKKPGYTKTFLLLPKEKNAEPKSFFHRLLYGKEDPYEYIPINSYQMKGADSIVVKKFVDEGVEEEIVYPANTVSPGFAKANIVKKN